MFFRGRDIHSGWAPNANPSTQEAWEANAQLEKTYNLLGPQNRAVFVSYPSDPVCTRDTQLSISPPLHFGNLGAHVSQKHTYHNIVQHGSVTLGTAENYSNFLTRDALFSAYNLLALSGISLGISINDILKKTTYLDETGKTCRAEPVSFDLVEDRNLVIKRRSEVQFMKNLVELHYVPFTKQQLVDKQQELANEQMQETSSGAIPLQNVSITSTQTTFAADFPEIPLHQVQTILSKATVLGRVRSFFFFL
jgi:hypothetical protein